MVDQEGMGGRGKLVFSQGVEGGPKGQNVVPVRFFGEFYADRGQVPVFHRHPEALGADHGACGKLDGGFVRVQPPPDLHGLLLTFFLFPADIGDHIAGHFRPVGKASACPADRLICAGHHLQRLIGEQRGEGGDITLDGAVGLDHDKAAPGAQAFALRRDHLAVFRVDFRDQHGHIRQHPGGGVVADDGQLRPGIGIFQGQGFRLVKGDGGEHQVHLFRHPGYLACVLNHQGFNALRHRVFHMPAAFHRLLIALPGASGAGRQGGHGKPGVLTQQGHQALAHHAGGAQDARSQLFHHAYPPVIS